MHKNVLFLVLLDHFTPVLSWTKHILFHFSFFLAEIFDNVSAARSSNLLQQQRSSPPAHGNLTKYVLNFEFVIGRQVRDGDRERESETQITGHSTLLSHKMQEKMAAEAGNKATTAQRHEATTQMFLSFSKSKLCYLTGKPQWAKRHLRPPGSHSKELAKTISLKSPAILIWQPDSITRRKNCFSRHQQSSGNYLNCVMIMPHSSGGELYVAPFQTHRSTSWVLWAPLHQHSGRRERMRGK